jgi:hypothetical protein
MEKASHSRVRAVVTEISGRGAYFIRSSGRLKNIFFCLSLNSDGKAIFLPAANRFRRRRLERSAHEANGAISQLADVSPAPFTKAGAPGAIAANPQAGVP